MWASSMCLFCLSGRELDVRAWEDEPVPRSQSGQAVSSFVLVSPCTRLPPGFCPPYLVILVAESRLWRARREIRWFGGKLAAGVQHVPPRTSGWCVCWLRPGEPHSCRISGTGAEKPPQVSTEKVKHWTTPWRGLAGLPTRQRPLCFLNF